MPYHSLHPYPKEKDSRIFLAIQPSVGYLPIPMTSLLQLCANDHAKHMGRAVAALAQRDMVRFDYHVEAANLAFRYYNKLCPLGKPETSVSNGESAAIECGRKNQNTSA